MKMKRKLAGFSACALVLSSLTVPVAHAASVDFEDIDSHWAKDSIKRWASYEIVNGFGNNEFKPEDTMTRAQMAQILSKILGLTATATTNPFTDVKNNDWFKDAILKCNAAGIMKGTSDTTANPNANISRQDAVTMMGRALGIEASGDATTFNDNNSIGSWAIGFVNAMAERGIVNGRSEGMFAPTGDVKRGEITTILDRAIVTYVNTPNTEVAATGKGIILIAAPGVTVKGESGDILITPAAIGTTKLDSVKVSGAVTMRAANSILALNGSTTAAKLNVSTLAKGVKITIEKDATVTVINSSADDVAIDGAGNIANMTVKNGEGVIVARSVKVGKITNASAGSIKHGANVIAGIGEIANDGKSDSSSYSNNSRGSNHSGSGITDDGKNHTNHSTSEDSLTSDTYVIACASVTGVTLEADSLKAKAGDTVTITATPTTGYTVTDITVTGKADNTDVTVNKGTADNIWTFVMPNEEVTVSASTAEIVPLALTYSADVTPAQSVEARQDTAALTPDENGVYTVKKNADITVALTFDRTIEALTYQIGDGDAQNATIIDGKATIIIPANDLANDFTVMITAVSLTPETYAIACDSVTGVTLETDFSKAKAGDTVTITATPETNYIVAGVTVTGESGSVTVNQGTAENTWTFVMPSEEVTVSASIVENVNLALAYSADVTPAQFIEAMQDTVALTPNENGVYTVKKGADATIMLTFNRAVETLTYQIEDGDSQNATITDGKATIIIPANDLANDFTVMITAVSLTPETYAIACDSVTGVTLEANSLNAKAGDIITITAIPAADYTVTGVTVTGASGFVTVHQGTAENTWTFTMPNEAVTVSAAAIPTYAIACDNVTGATLKTDSLNAKAGDTITITAIPEADYVVTDVIVTGANDSITVHQGTAENTWTFTMPSEAVTVSAVAIPTYAIACDNVTGATLKTDSLNAKAGDTITITATPEADYVVTDVTVTGANDSIAVNQGTAENTWTFTMPNEAVTVSATAVQTYAIACAVVTGATLETDSLNAKTGDIVTITAIPEADYVVTDVIVTGASDSVTVHQGTAENTWTFVMPSEAVTVSAAAIPTYAIACAVVTGATLETDSLNAKTGDIVTITAIPEADYVVTDVIVTGANDSIAVHQGTAENTWTFTMPNEAVTVSATAVQTYAIACAAVTGATLKTDPLNAKAGDTVTITATPEANYVVTDVTVSGASGSVTVNRETTDNAWTFVMPSEAVTVSASTAETVKLTLAYGADVTHAQSVAVKQGAATLTPDANGVYTVKKGDDATIKLTFDQPVEAMTYQINGKNFAISKNDNATITIPTNDLSNNSTVTITCVSLTVENPTNSISCGAITYKIGDDDTVHTLDQNTGAISIFPSVGNAGANINADAAVIVIARDSIEIEGVTYQLDADSTSFRLVRQDNVYMPLAGTRFGNAWTFIMPRPCVNVTVNVELHFQVQKTANPIS